MGTSVGTEVFVNHGWRANALLAMGWFIWQLGILLLRGPGCPRQRWIGWEGGFWMRTVESTALPGQASGRTSDCEKAEVSQASVGGFLGTSEEDKES